MYMESTLWQRCLQNNGRVSMDKKSGKLLIMIINCSPLPHSPGDTIRACTVLQSLSYLLLLLIVTKKLCCYLQLRSQEFIFYQYFLKHIQELSQNVKGTQNFMTQTSNYKQYKNSPLKSSSLDFQLTRKTRLMVVSDAIGPSSYKPLSLTLPVQAQALETLCPGAFFQPFKSSLEMCRS